VGLRRPLALGAVATLITVGCTAATGAGPATPRLPTLARSTIAYDGDVGDPFVLTSAGTARYVLFGTDDWPSHVPTASSPDLHAWRQGPDALPVLPAWARPDPENSQTWAPAALRTASGYLLYISVVDAASGRHCIAVARSASPLGPYRDAIGRPLVCQVSLGGSIDPSVTGAVGPHADGTMLFAWKSDGNCCGLPASLWEQNLRPDGLALVGAPHRLLTASLAWQAGIIENPALLPASSGGYWLFYSGNRFDRAGYATGLAYCPSLAGPCRETADHPFLSGTDTEFAPGGLDFFRDGAGQLWASFATWSRPARNGQFYCCRPLNVAGILAS
jgi:beta-xylosidase